ncbi:hypothetical protein PSY52_23295, partial [Shigella flexneri]|nr:hypothetical protein [Shigella flexneri]
PSPHPHHRSDRMLSAGLSDDADAEREAGAQVMRETEQQIYRQLCSCFPLRIRIIAQTGCFQPV